MILNLWPRRKKHLQIDDKYYVSAKTHGGAYKHFQVPVEVYVYVQQLEAAVRDPANDKIKEQYSERFTKDKEEENYGN